MQTIDRYHGVAEQKIPRKNIRYGIKTHIGDDSISNVLLRTSVIFWLYCVILVSTSIKLRLVTCSVIHSFDNNAVIFPQIKKIVSELGRLFL